MSMLETFLPLVSKLCVWVDSFLGWSLGDRLASITTMTLAFAAFVGTVETLGSFWAIVSPEVALH